MAMVMCCTSTFVSQGHKMSIENLIFRIMFKEWRRLLHVCQEVITTISKNTVAPSSYYNISPHSELYRLWRCHTFILLHNSSRSLVAEGLRLAPSIRESSSETGPMSSSSAVPTTAAAILVSSLESGENQRPRPLFPRPKKELDHDQPAPLLFLREGFRT